MGGWESFQESAGDIARHGADSGWSGFTYYRETVAFARRNRAAILEALQDMASGCGQGVLELVQSFRCIGKDYSLDEIGQAIYAGKGDAAQTVLNGLAWYALEEVALAYDDRVAA